ncbi:c-type cytochrome [Chitinimonas sp.]|uniref:c-type cytochrome n=1 Tax=Chitinimonas sp. TaxID=1934313 RepID=UPI0035B269A7
MKSLFVASALLAATAAFAAPDGQAIAAKHNCLACHAVDHKIVGPAYKDVAAKYKGDANAAARLAAKVKAGGVGVWGNIPMPAQQISDADVKIIVNWVLTSK